MLVQAPGKARAGRRHGEDLGLLHTWAQAGSTGGDYRRVPTRVLQPLTTTLHGLSLGISASVGIRVFLVATNLR